MRDRIKLLLTFVCVTAASVAAVLTLAWAVRAGVADEPPKHEPGARAVYDALRHPTFDPNAASTLWRGDAVRPNGEAPVLVELVAAGKLPPLAERMPREPVVYAGGDGIGKYGGTWLRLATGMEDVGVITWRLSGSFLVRWSPLGYPIEPHVAKSVEPSPDRRQWTVTLRAGMRWSDGAAFDADDVMYWWNDEANNTLVASTPPAWMAVGGKFGRVVKLDQQRVRFEFDKPYPLFLESLAMTGDPCGSPAHFLRPYHPDPLIGDESLIERDMARFKMPSAGALYGYVKQWQNPEHPRLWPWVYRAYRGNAPQVFVRNPYYFAVDVAGNQLPYIDRLQFDVQDTKMLALSAANGATAMQARHLNFADYTELMSRRDVAGTRVLHWYSATRSMYVINPNLNRRVDPKDPATAWKAKLLADRRFRQALSLAIDREAVIRAEYVGVGEPAQVAPGPQSRFPGEDLRTAFTEHDPERARHLLDELRLTGRDAEGYRTFPDGSRMTFYLDSTTYTGNGPSQFVVDDWGAVGVRAVVRERARSLFYTEKDAGNFDFNVWTGESDLMPLLSPRYFIPYNTEAFYAVGWGRWYSAGGFYDSPRSRELRGAIPVPKDSPMYRAIADYEAALRATDPAEQKRLVDDMLSIAAENTWTIGISTSPPQLVVASKDMKNVPEDALMGAIFSTPSNAGMETFYFAHPDASAGAVAEVKSSIERVTPRPAANGDDAAPAATVGGSLVKWLLIGIVLLGVAMAAWRHPFVWRRLLIMVPTLLVISVIVFGIIRLPPGDYLTSRIMLLQESGDAANLRAIDDLKRVFRYDEPAWRQYVRWMGLGWFATLDPADTGLLQGNLGRSMETMQPINEVVGDRLMLTVVLSLFTIAFTWAVALPIGIYSAVRQYSVGDYVLTLLGFVGMCTPAFLLALVLMAVSGVSGLFSPFYAAQPEWTWGKVLDLGSHLWIPVLVLGVGGTAGMIRVMRANLLDELRKPYVTTAMAKGVRPTRLLLKYPVRLALNPFVSGIGSLFPQIVSGGAIVAMVLALPTVGPLLLSALMTEDMYLAGSMLMVLSLLGVFGTLVSDLLLLWLDPRIRFEGGSR